MSNTKMKRHPFVKSPVREAHERVLHLRDVNMQYDNGRTVKNVTAFVRRIDGVDYVSFAENDERDQFSRRVGRTVARRKWFQNKRVPLKKITLADGQATKDARLYDAVYATYMES